MNQPQDRERIVEIKAHASRSIEKPTDRPLRNRRLRGAECIVRCSSRRVTPPIGRGFIALARVRVRRAHVGLLQNARRIAVDLPGFLACGFGTPGLTGRDKVIRAALDAAAEMPGGEAKRASPFDGRVTPGLSPGVAAA